MTGVTFLVLVIQMFEQICLCGSLAIVTWMILGIDVDIGYNKMLLITVVAAIFFRAVCEGILKYIFKKGEE